MSDDMHEFVRSVFGRTEPTEPPAPTIPAGDTLDAIRGDLDSLRDLTGPQLDAAADTLAARLTAITTTVPEQPTEQPEPPAPAPGLVVSAEGRGTPPIPTDGPVRFGSLAEQMFGTTFTPGGPRYRREAS